MTILLGKKKEVRQRIRKGGCNGCQSDGSRKKEENSYRYIYDFPDVNQGNWQLAINN